MKKERVINKISEMLQYRIDNPEFNVDKEDLEHLQTTFKSYINLIDEVQ